MSELVNSSSKEQMEENKNHWRSRIYIVNAEDLGVLQKFINEFCKDKFVVGIQYPESLQPKEGFVAVISYKVQENGD